MASPSSEKRALPGALYCALVLQLASCGREDIELSRHRPPDTAGSVADDCSAAVPSNLRGPRPPLGWNGYNAFECAPELNEAKVKANVDAMVASGMRAAGYQYVNLDKCWESPRSAAGTRVFDATKLPGGIEGLAAYVHERGLLLGVFAPTHDCLEAPGGAGHEQIDAETYAAWGIDYVKYVSCVTGAPGEDQVIGALSHALSTVSRPIVLSITSPPFAEWMPKTSQLWRTGANAAPTWDFLVEAIDTTVPLAAYARPGAFNDPDMLEIGNGAFSEAEARVQFTVWSILAAPLLAGNDLSSMSEATRALLTNEEVIALDQDPLGLQGALVRREGSIDVLAKPLTGCGARGVVLWNRDSASAQVTLTWPELWLSPGATSARDLWKHQDLAVDATGITVEVPGHDAVALRVVGVEPPGPAGDVFLSDLPWTYAVNGHGPAEIDRSNGEDLPTDGQPMRLRGAAYDKGVGAHGPSLIRYRLGQACTRFTADVGIDDETEGQGSADFEVWADGEKLFESGIMTGTTPPKRVDVDVTGRRDLRLFVSVGGDDFHFDHADWAGARLVCD